MPLPPKKTKDPPFFKLARCLFFFSFLCPLYHLLNYFPLQVGSPSSCFSGFSGIHLSFIKWESTNGDGNCIMSSKVAVAEHEAEVTGHAGKGMGSSLVNMTFMQA